MRTLLPILLLGLGCLAGCGKTAPPTASLDLTGFYASADTAGLARTIRDRHKPVRDQLDELILQLLRARSSEDSEAADSLEHQLSWLCAQYETISRLQDKTRKLGVYRRWSATEALQKLSLDSSFRAIVTDYDRLPDSLKALRSDDQLTRLHRMRAEYSSLLDSFYIARVDFSIATTLERENAIDSAEYYLARCRSICRSLGYLELRGHSEFRLARNSDIYRADYGRAMEAWRLAQKFFERAGDQPYAASALSGQAAQLANLYQSSEAIELYCRALRIAQASGIAPQEYYCLYALGEVYYDLGMLDSASFYTDQSIRLCLGKMGGDASWSTRLGFGHSSIGLIAQGQDDPASAASDFEAANELARRTDDAALLCTNNIRWAALLIEQGSYSRAKELCQEALERSYRFEDNLFAQYGMSVADHFLGDFESSKRGLHRCISLYEQSRQSLPRPGARTGMLSDKIGFYNLLIVMFIQEYQRTGQRSSLDSAFHHLERSKAQSLREMLSTDPAHGRGSQGNQLRDRIRSLEDTLLQGDGDRESIISAIGCLGDSLSALVDEQTPDSSSLPQSTDLQPTDLQTVQARLLDQTDLVLEYVVTDFGSYVFLIDQREVQIREIPMKRDSLDRIVGRYVESISKYPSATDAGVQLRELARQLYACLIPMEDLNRLSKAHLILIPTARLQTLPFESLMNPKGSLLIEQYDVSYLPSLTVLEMLSARPFPVSTRKLVAFGNPALNSSTLDSLPYSARELDSLVAIFGTDHAQLFAGADATAASFRTHDFKGDRYVHIAAHGLVDDRHPGNSELVLSPAADGRDDGRLPAGEIASMRIPADLAFLAACRTGSGKSFEGEGVMSLVQPFLVAGCRSVVVSYWDVFDRYAAELIPRFYRYHLEGYTNVHSLTLAKRDLLHSKSGLARHPYFWAPYVLVGDEDQTSASGDPLRKRVR